jgi:dipeptidyl aminopeptidase/acylaminoacyl peptidase
VVEPVIAALAIAGLGLIAYLALCAMLYNRITQVPADSPIFQSPNMPTEFSTEEVDCRPYLMPRFEDVTFPDRTGSVGIAGWLIPAEGDPHAPAVVVVHGYTASRRDAWILLAAGMLHRHGFSVLAIDLRNHGDSGRTGGRHTGGVLESSDVLGAWDWLISRQGLAPEAVGLFGISLGAASVVMAAGDEPRVAAVWSDSGYGDIDDATRAELRRNHLPPILLPGGLLVGRILDGPGVRAKSPLAAMARLGGRPVFITHGTADTRLDVHFADQLIEAGRATGALVESWIVEDSDHAAAIVDHPVEYERRLTEFFEQLRPGGRDRSAH